MPPSKLAHLLSKKPAPVPNRKKARKAKKANAADEIVLPADGD
jgi:hypothetical protein